MNEPTDAPRVLLLGSESGFCFHTLKALRECRVPIAGVLIAAGTEAQAWRPVTRGALPLSQPGTVTDLAARDGLITLRCGNTREQWVRELVREMAPAVVLVACLPERLDDFWMDLAPGGCLNLHPSLLPAYRGPAPLFWQLRDGLEQTGFTLHRVEEALDAGPVLAAEAHAIDPEDNLATLNALLAAAGARAFAGRLQSIVSGAARYTPQDETKASAHPWPRDRDFALDPGWSAARAFRFVRATASLGRPYPMTTEAGALVIERALDFDAEASMDEAFVEKGGVLTLRFAEGTLRAVGKTV